MGDDCGLGGDSAALKPMQVDIGTGAPTVEAGGGDI